MAAGGVIDRSGRLTPPLPCPHCRALYPMRILSWQGQICQCRPYCDAESADARVCCTGCGQGQELGYDNEGSAAWMDYWIGPDDAWRVQSWPEDGGGWAVAIEDPPDAGFGPGWQWLAEIADLLEKGAYPFPSLKEPA